MQWPYLGVVSAFADRDKGKTMKASARVTDRTGRD
jgi:hypothetical protein